MRVLVLIRATTHSEAGVTPATGELVAGFWMWEVKDMDEAVDWIKRCSNPMPDPSQIEIRPFFEMEDFGEEFTRDLREQEERLREEMEGR